MRYDIRMMYKLDPDRLDLAREFKAQPYGRHSDDLQRLLNAMRGGGFAGRLVAICLRRHKEWALGRMGAGPYDAIRRIDARVFTAFEDIEWEIFRIRWREMTGRELSV